MFSKTNRYFREVRTELQKATWPWDPKEKGFKKFRELTDATVVVVIAMLLLAGFVAFCDLCLTSAVKLITSL